MVVKKISKILRGLLFLARQVLFFIAFSYITCKSPNVLLELVSSSTLDSSLHLSNARYRSRVQLVTLCVRCVMHAIDPPWLQDSYDDYRISDLLRLVADNSGVSRGRTPTKLFSLGRGLYCRLSIPGTSLRHGYGSSWSLLGHLNNCNVMQHTKVSPMPILFTRPLWLDVADFLETRPPPRVTMPNLAGRSRSKLYATDIEEKKSLTPRRSRSLKTIRNN